MEDSKSLLVISAIVNKQYMAELNDYLGSVMQIFGKYGGKPAGRYKTMEALLGEDTPDMMAIIEFPNTDLIKDMVKGLDFNALSEMRARVFRKLNMMICGGM